MRPIFQPARATRPVDQGVNRAAQRALYDAIAYAHAHELLTLLKEVTRIGAALDIPDSDGNDVYTTAVVHDRPHAIRTLAAVCAPLPDVGPDGIDPVMRAAMLDHGECCRMLIECASYEIDSTDRLGRNALFIAVESKALDATRVLLEVGADPEASTRELSDTVLGQLFGEDHDLLGKEVTAMMVAVALGRPDLVDLLRSAGADACDGDCPPLHLAARNHDEPMLRHLLSTGVEVAASLDENGNDPIDTAQRCDAPLPCLRLLAAHYDFSGDDLADEQGQHLRTAIAAGNASAVALFLAHGASLPDAPDDERSSWRIASRLPQGSNHMLDLMATLDADSMATPTRVIENRVFRLLEESHTRPHLLAAEGLYPSLFASLSAAMVADPAGREWRTPPQRELHMAMLCAERLGRHPPAIAPAPPAEGADENRDLLWMRKTSEYTGQQHAAVLAAAQTLHDTARKELEHALDLPFFIAMTDACPDEEPLHQYIARRLEEHPGLPHCVATRIAHAWHDAARNARDWLDADLPLDAANAFVHQRALCLLTDDLESLAEPSGDPMTPTVMHWVDSALALATQRLAVAGFAAQPVQWLMRIEGRTNLRPADPKLLTAKLQSALGLPPTTCSALAEGWARALAHGAAQGRAAGPAALWREVSRAFIDCVEANLVDNDSDVLPNVASDAAAAWCASLNGPLPAPVAPPPPASMPLRVPHPRPEPDLPDPKRRRTQ